MIAGRFKGPSGEQPWKDFVRFSANALPTRACPTCSGDCTESGVCLLSGIDPQVRQVVGQNVERESLRKKARKTVQKSRPTHTILC